MFFRSRQSHAPPFNTTPITRRMAKKSLWRSSSMTLLVITAFCGALYWFGSPALRIEYTYSGSKDYRNYHYCLYLSLNGWHRIKPYYGVNQCPILTFVPLRLPL